MSKSKSSVRILCDVALLVALEVVLNRFCSINTDALKIGFSFIPMALCGMLYGPGWAAGAYAMADFIGAILFPIGPYHPGFTVGAAMRGAMYGFFLHKEPVAVERLGDNMDFNLHVRWNKFRLFPNYLMPTLINCILISLVIDTAWVSMLYGSKTYWGWFVYRLSQYLVLIPLNLIFLPILRKFADQLIKMGITGVKNKPKQIENKPNQLAEKQ